MTPSELKTLAGRMLTKAQEEAQPDWGISPRFALMFGLRWSLRRYGNDPCDEWDVETMLGLPDGLFWRNGQITFVCRSCDNHAPWEGEISDFEEGHYANVCGGSPRCLP